MSRSDRPAPLPAEFADALQRAADRIPLLTRCLWYPELTSTNDVAAALADSGAPEGVVVVADTQTAGRGRLGRTWASPPGAGIYATVLLRPDPHAARLVTLAAGVALADGIESATGLAASVKWPNDIVLGGGAGVTHRKLAGILAEGGTSVAAPAPPEPPEGSSHIASRARTPEAGRYIAPPARAPEGGPCVAEGDGLSVGGGGAWVVVGFGINVLPAAYPPEVAVRATSLEAELGRPVDRGLVLAECLSAFSRRYDELRGGHAAAVVTAWRARAVSTFGRRVEWDANGAAQQGIARDVDASGALLVSTGAGMSRIVSGEVRWI